MPETREGGPPVEFGRCGADLAVILPPKDKGNLHRRALWVVANWIRRKAPNGVFMTPDKLTDEVRRRQLILLGTPRGNPIVQQVLAESAPGFLDGIPPGGYHIQALPHPWQKKKWAVLAVGADDVGAWRAAIVLCFSIHPRKVGKLERWPVNLPDGTYWAPFEAKGTEGAPSPGRAAPRAKRLPPPRIPFGVRTWGSPTPTLATYERLVRSLQKCEINTIILLPGGWQDVADAGEVCRRALDIAYRAGMFTILYVGNDEKAHRPAPLTDKHKAVVAAVKDHPGLLGWRLYNQLTHELSDAERRMIREQAAWLRSVSDKPVGMEVVWGHNLKAAPDRKVRLIEDLRSWNVTEIAHDYAPVGGWSKSHDIRLWEGRIEALHAMKVTPLAVIQAHVPFKGPALPTRAEVRNQFWWCVAAGAKGFFFEVAYSYNHFSNRGLFTWTLEPVPDGRADEVRSLARIARRLEEMLLTSQPAPDEIDPLGIQVERGRDKAAVRLRRSPGGVIYLLFISTDLHNPAHIECSLRGPCRVEEIAPGGSAQTVGAQGCLAMDLPPGGGACFRIQRTARR